jgi:hypothetical protein
MKLNEKPEKLSLRWEKRSGYASRGSAWVGGLYWRNLVVSVNSVAIDADSELTQIGTVSQTMITTVTATIANLQIVC